MALEHLPPVWTNQDIVLYHGTTVEAAREIAASGIDLRYGTRQRDFGPGFYTTTMEGQTRRFAKKVVQLPSRRLSGEAAVVELTIDREDLASLYFLGFVEGGFDAEQFWSFVHSCRNGAVDHGRRPADDLGITTWCLALFRPCG